MLPIQNWVRRRVFSLLMALLVIVLITACSEEPKSTANVNPAPTAKPTTRTLLPTPTLVPGVPPPPIPTPPITPTVEKGALTGALEEVGEGDSHSGPPTATPELGDRLDLANSSLDYGDYDTAVEQFSAALRQEPQMKPEAQSAVLYSLGAAYLADEQYGDAATMFNQLLTLPGGSPPPAADFHLGRASFELGDFATAVDAYRAYLDDNPDMAAYVQPLIAEAYLALGDSESALKAYEAALTGPSYRLKEVKTRLIIAGNYLGAGEYDKAIVQYDAVHDLAETEATRGQMTYLAGAAELMAGDTDAAYDRFLFGIEAYPGAYESYLGLVELVKAEEAVDSFQRGLVDFQAAAYAPGIVAFEDHISTNPENYEPESHLYLALSHEALGDLDAALAELDRYVEFDPAKALQEKAKMQGRAGEIETAVDLYQQFLDEYPQEEDAPLAAWWLAASSEQLGDVEEAITRYVQLAEDYPDHEDTPEALYHAGWLAQDNEDPELGQSLWQRAAETYPNSRFGSAATVRLLRTEPEEGSDLLLALQDLAANNQSDHYHALPDF